MSELCICQIYDGISEGYHYVESLDKHDNKIRADAEQSAWHIVKWHEITEEERKKEGYNKDLVYCLDCTMPKDEEEILVVTKFITNYKVDSDINIIDDGYYLDSGRDWRNDIIAWREMPKFDAELLKGKK